MTPKSQSLSFWQKTRFSWYSLLRDILHLWTKSRILPDPFNEAGINKSVISFYVIDSYALSSILILDACCEKLELPRPLLPIDTPGFESQRSYAALRRLRGLLVRIPSTRRSSESLKKLVEYSCENTDFEIQIIPVSVMIGRAPDKEQSLAKILFSEDWEVGGRIRRLIGSMINGRNTFVQFSKPISLRALVDEGLGADRTLRKLSRVLRTHFRRGREAALGPDLSHRRTLFAQIVNSPRVREAISTKARKDKISEQKARRIAEKHLREIAAHYSYTVIRVVERILHWFLNKIFDGVHLNHFDKYKDIAPGKTVVYVPCHRSHIDYLLVSYLLYQHGFVAPHVAAGINLNLPVIGAIVRRGGGFFLRRTFKTNLLYAAIFDEYVANIMAQGVALEYFIEGTRSRTGRLLQPRLGMLAMTVRGFLRARNRPVVFQPLSIGFERMAEGHVYTAELSGAPKKSESLRDFFSALKMLRRTYGKVHVSFGVPIYLEDMLDKHVPGWETNADESVKRPEWLPDLLEDLSTSIMSGINATAHVNPVNLLAMALLATRKHAIDRNDLVQQIELSMELLRQVPLAPRITITGLNAVEIVDYGIKLEIIESSDHKLGEIITTNIENAVLLTYFRNNVSHLFALPSFIACAFLNRQRLGRKRLERLFTLAYPYLKAELFLPWDPDQALETLREHLSQLVRLGLLREEQGGAMLLRAQGSSTEAIQLRLLGHGLLQTFERYYITVAVLVKNGNGTLSRAQLEQLCGLTAQRLSMLHEFEAPEFYDKNLFRNFISLLRENGVLNRNSTGKLEFDEVLEQVVEEAKLVLSKEIRHGIIQAAPMVLEESKTS